LEKDIKMLTHTWIVTGKNNAGVEFGPERFIHNQPKTEELYNLAFKWDGNENKDGGGDYGSNVHLTVTYIPVES